MKINKFILVTLAICTGILSCTKPEIKPSNTYACQFEYNDTSLTHPKASTYQNILDENQKKGMVGAVLLVKDQDGMWIGSTGQADIASNVDMQPCNRFLIASISKVFTAAAVFRYVDKGLIDIEDPISKWLSDEIVSKVANADKAKVKHLLAHQSGIPDYYTPKFELDRFNKDYNNFTKEEVLTYIYGKKANFDVGSTYGYCNTNYLLLSIILENASGLSFEQVYQNEVFNPLNLTSGYYSESNPIPDDCVKGYPAFNTKGTVTEGEHYYYDELGIGGDGGIAINAYDLAVFLERLMKGDLISQSSLNHMTDWFDIPEDWHWESYGQTENGKGLEKFNTEYGYAVGHTGGIDGFNTFGFYFPETDMTYILFVNNTKAFDTAKKDIFESVLKEMFE